MRKSDNPTTFVSGLSWKVVESVWHAGLKVQIFFKCATIYAHTHKPRPVNSSQKSTILQYQLEKTRNIIWYVYA